MILFINFFSLFRRETGLTPGAQIIRKHVCDSRSERGHGRCVFFDSGVPFYVTATIFLLCVFMNFVCLLVCDGFVAFVAKREPKWEHK